jgi:hypothetical protein
MGARAAGAARGLGRSLQGPVGQQARDAARIEPVAQFQHGLHPAEADDALLGARRDGAQRVGQQPRIVLVHQHGYAQAAPIFPQRAQRFEAAQVGAHEEGAAAGLQHGIEVVRAHDLHVEQVEVASQQVHAVEDGGGEMVDVGVALAPAGRAAEHAPQVVGRGARRGAAGTAGSTA